MLKLKYILLEFWWKYLYPHTYGVRIAGMVAATLPFPAPLTGCGINGNDRCRCRAVIRWQPYKRGICAEGKPQTVRSAGWGIGL